MRTDLDHERQGVCRTSLEFDSTGGLHAHSNGARSRETPISLNSLFGQGQGHGHVTHDEGAS